MRAGYPSKSEYITRVGLLATICFARLRQDQYRFKQADDWVNAPMILYAMVMGKAYWFKQRPPELPGFRARLFRGPGPYKPLNRWTEGRG